MQCTSREREQRTLSAHLECRDTFVAVCSYHNSLRETNGKPFCCGFTHTKKKSPAKMYLILDVSDIFDKRRTCQENSCLC